MRHRKNNKKLSLRNAHRVSLIRNMCKSLISCEQVVTTLSKAKVIRRVVEKLITTGKKQSLHSRRKLISQLGGSLKDVNKILSILAPRYKERKGGYTRILKAGYRKGDCAPIAVIQLMS